MGNNVPAERNMWEAGLDVILYFCSYHGGKKKKKTQIFGLFSPHSSLHNVWTFLFEAEDG